MSTVYGAVALSNDVQRTRSQLKDVQIAVGQGILLADTVLGPENLGFRVAKGEAPNEAEIPELQGQLAGVKAQLLAAVNAIEVKSVEEYTALASSEEPDPADTNPENPEPEPEPEP